MNVFRLCLHLGLSLTTIPVWADQCASSYDQLEKTERLQTLQEIFKDEKRVTFVNQTQGSYFVLESKNDKFNITFLTSGLFDLYGVRREGELVFCDTGIYLSMIGLGRIETLYYENGRLRIGKGGPKMDFTQGPMPALLKKLHPDVVERLPAVSEKSPKAP